MFRFVCIYTPLKEYVSSDRDIQFSVREFIFNEGSIRKLSFNGMI